MRKRLREKRKTRQRDRSLDILWRRALREPDPVRRYELKVRVHTLRRRRCLPPIVFRDELRIPVEGLVSASDAAAAPWIFNQGLADLHRAYPGLRIAGVEGLVSAPDALPAPWIFTQGLADLRRAYPGFPLPGEPAWWKRVPARQAARLQG